MGRSARSPVKRAPGHRGRRRAAVERPTKEAAAHDATATQDPPLGLSPPLSVAGVSKPPCPSLPPLRSRICRSLPARVLCSAACRVPAAARAVVTRKTRAPPPAAERVPPMAVGNKAGGGGKGNDGEGGGGGGDGNLSTCAFVKARHVLGEQHCMGATFSQPVDRPRCRPLPTAAPPLFPPLWSPLPLLCLGRADPRARPPPTRPPCAGQTPARV